MNNKTVRASKFEVRGYDGDENAAGYVSLGEYASYTGAKHRADRIIDETDHWLRVAIVRVRVVEEEMVYMDAPTKHSEEPADAAL